MKCDLCENEATVHEVTVKSGVKVEKHLCESCARQQGIAVQPSPPINELITKYVMAHGAAAAPPPPRTPGATRVTVCPTCGTTYAEFRQTGLLGCPDCYKAFESQLSPLLERAHEGAAHHVGKVPRRTLAASRLPQGSGPSAPRGIESVLGGAEERIRRLISLRKQLDEAVKAEQYERAAKIRDELRRLNETGAAREREKGA